MLFPAGLIEHQCPRCHREVEELAFGAICGVCHQEIERRAAKWGNQVSLVTTILFAAYLYFFRRAPNPTARIISVMAVAIWFMVTNIVVRRAVREMTR